MMSSEFRESLSYVLENHQLFTGFYGDYSFFPIGSFAGESAQRFELAFHSHGSHREDMDIESFFDRSLDFDLIGTPIDFKGMLISGVLKF
jgi:hypothetical protein